MRPPLVNAEPAASPLRTELATLVLLGLAIAIAYSARLSRQPLVGEETRWATAAREMIETGDWIVPRQQGQVFPERPPMTMWLMAIGGCLRGDVDPIAVRLPSALAVVATSLLIYAYSRSLLSWTAAIASALVYASFGQVMQIGRLGESEAVFAFLVGASLLVWHLGYSRCWPPIVVWSVGFTCAALAALVKGPQAPVYFIAITAAYLTMQCDLRYLLSWQAAVGGLVFVMIVGAWQVPFYRAAGGEAVIATWAGLAGDRVYLRGMISHAFSYPVETLACLLPWSPMLFALLRPGCREMLADKKCVVRFALIAIFVAYPTVWLAAGARGRYFMPIYPVVAVLIGLLIDRASISALGSSQRRGWHLFVLGWGVVIGAGALFVGASGMTIGDAAQQLYQPRWFCFVIACVALAVATTLWAHYRWPRRVSAIGVVAALWMTVALGVAGFMTNVNVARWNDPSAVVAAFKRLIPPGARIASFTPIEHRFAYYFADPIAELPWPRTMNDAPHDTDYFCFMRNKHDTAESRASGRGRTMYRTPGTLPFAWEEMTAIRVERQLNARSPTEVVLGRVVRPLRAEVSDATKPHATTVRQLTEHPRRMNF